jgi:hypothetical protein
MQRLARPVVPLKEAAHDPSGVVQSGFVPLLLHMDPRLLALSFASALAPLACLSWLEVSQVTLKTTKPAHRRRGNQSGPGLYRQSGTAPAISSRPGSVAIALVAFVRAGRWQTAGDQITHQSASGPRLYPEISGAQMAGDGLSY